MKKIAAFLMGIGLVSFGWAQEAGEPLPEEWEIASESEIIARRAMDATLVAADTALEDRIKKLESALKIGGYLGTTLTWSSDAGTTAFTDHSPENTRFRFNFSFTDAIFVMKARVQFRPLKGNITAPVMTGTDTADGANVEKAVEGALDYLQMVYYDVAAKLFDGALTLTGGKVRITDYATYFYGARDRGGLGYIDEAPGFEAKLSMPNGILPAGQKLSLGVFVPVANISGAKDSLNSSDLIDVNLVYGYNATNMLRFGYLGGDLAGPIDSSKTSYFSTGKNNLDVYARTPVYGWQTYYMGLSTDIMGLVPGLNLGVIPSYSTEWKDDGKTSSFLSVLATLGYTIGDFYTGLDFYYGKLSTDVDTEPYLSTFFTMDYTIKDLLGKGVHLVPELEVRFENHLANSAVNDAVMTISPEFNIRAGKSEFRVGTDITTSLTGSDPAFLDSANKDQMLVNLTVGYLLNF